MPSPPQQMGRSRRGRESSVETATTSCPALFRENTCASYKLSHRQDAGVRSRRAVPVGLLEQKLDPVRPILFKFFFLPGGLLHKQGPRTSRIWGDPLPHSHKLFSWRSISVICLSRVVRLRCHLPFDISIAFLKPWLATSHF
jgi:hypothetical protein